MSVSRKIFLAMSGFIVTMSLLFLWLVHLVVDESFDAIVRSSKGAVIEAVSEAYIRDYEAHGRTWAGLAAHGLPAALEPVGPDVGLVLLGPDRQRIAAAGAEHERRTIRLGIERELRLNGSLIGRLYYNDPEVANLTKLKFGISISLRLLLGICTALFLAVSLLAAYLISRHLTSPLRRLAPAIERLGRGEYGVQAPVTTKDEYGAVAAAFNGMSAQLRQTEEARRQLVADVAHELRTPLTIVQGQLDQLQQAGRPVEPVTLLPLQDELIRLSRLVDDLLLLSLAEARKLPLKLQPTDMPAWMERLIERVSFAAADKELDIRFTHDVRQRHYQVDPHRLGQACLNLLTNAIRYTPEGGTIDVGMTETTADGRSGLAISIRDSGPGIAPEHLPRLFDRFYRTDEARARHSGGIGLGLAIARQFVAQHGGKIEVDSRLGHGTLFTVTLPGDHVLNGST